jgi:hypothetical protein
MQERRNKQVDFTSYLPRLTWITIVDYIVKTLPKFLVLCVAILSSMQVSAVTDENGIYETQRFEMSGIFDLDESLLRHQVLAGNENGSSTVVQPSSGDLVIPGASEDKAKKKKCVTVCDEWGRDCIINPRTGQRKCRRMCKSFGEECI